MSSVQVFSTPDVSFAGNNQLNLTTIHENAQVFYKLSSKFIREFSFSTLENRAERIQSKA